MAGHGWLVQQAAGIAESCPFEAAEARVVCHSGFGPERVIAGQRMRMEALRRLGRVDSTSGKALADVSRFAAAA